MFRFSGKSSLDISSLVALDNVDPATQGVNTNLYISAIICSSDIFARFSSSTTHVDSDVAVLIEFNKKSEIALNT